jgi:O-antigen/teichoic acid export membrane protein
VFNESFVYSALIFNFYLLLIIPRVLFPQSILTGLGKTKFLLLSSIIEIIINVSLSVYFAGKIGLPGVALGTFIAYSADKIFLMLVAKFVYDIDVSSYLKITPFVVYCLLTLLVFAISYGMMLRGVWMN